MTEQQQGQSGPTAELMDRAEQLIWSLLDDNLSKEGVSELETMLRSHEAVRKLYHHCVRLHVDLMGHYGKTPPITIPGMPNSPVLGSLGDTTLGMDPGTPVTD